MAFAVTNRTTVGSSTTAATSKTSASFTPSADSLLVVMAHVEGPDGGSTTAPSWTITDSLSSTWTKRAESTHPGGAYNGTFVVWTTPIGGSPASMTVTVDPYTSTPTGWIAYSIFDVTGHNVSTPIVQVKAGTTGTNSGPTTRTLTLTLDATTSTANLILAGFGSSSDGGTAPGTPTSFTSISSAAGPYDGVRSAYRISSAQSTVASSLGSTYFGDGAVLEIAPASTTVTGTSATTNAAFTSAASGSTATGSSAQTLAAFTSSASGTFTPSEVTGTSAQTLAAFTSTATGIVNVTGTSAQTIAAATSTASGTVTSSGSYFFDDLNQADGAPTGWSSLGGTDWGVVSNKGSTNGSTAAKGMYIAHGVDLSGDWEIQATINASTTISNGGVTLGLADATGVGYSLFAGNSSHVQIRTTGYAGGGNLTNDGRASRTTQVRMTYTASSNTFRTYHDGVLTGSVVDTTNTAMMSGAVNLLVHIQETTAPTNECTVDDIYVADFLGGTYPPAATVTGSSGTTNAAFTSAASGSTVTGTSAQTLAAFTSTAAGSTVTGSVAQTLADLTSTAAAAHGVAGTSAQTLADLTSTAQGTTVTGSSAATLDAFTSTASGTHSISGTSTQTLADFTSSATGQFGNDVSGTVAATLDAFTSTAAGTTVTGTSAQTLAAFTGSASGTFTITGSSAQTLADLTSTAAGSSTTGTSATTNAAFASTATGQFGTDPTGTVAATLAAFTSTASGSTVTGSSAQTLTDATSTATGGHGPSGTSAQTLAAFTATAAGSTVSGAVAATLADWVAASGGSSTAGTVAQTLAAFTSTATGTAGDVVVIGVATLAVWTVDQRASVAGSVQRATAVSTANRAEPMGSVL